MISRNIKPPSFLHRNSIFKGYPRKEFFLNRDKKAREISGGGGWFSDCNFRANSEKDTPTAITARIKNAYIIPLLLCQGFVRPILFECFASNCLCILSPHVLPLPLLFFQLLFLVYLSNSKKAPILRAISLLLLPSISYTSSIVPVIP